MRPVLALEFRFFVGLLLISTCNLLGCVNTSVAEIISEENPVVDQSCRNGPEHGQEVCGSDIPLTQTTHSTSSTTASTTTSFCIESGDETEINSALADGGFGAAVVLCPGAVFRLKHSIVFTDERQSIYTAGRPCDNNNDDGDQRALLQVDHQNLATAVNMLDREYALLSNVRVDGNRRQLGEILTDPESGSRTALIAAGGKSRGTVVRDVHAFDPRGRSCLHVLGGDPDHRCHWSFVERNTLGGSSVSGGQQPTISTATNTRPTHGLSFACLNSIVRNNTIRDATGAGILIAGSAGSILTENLVVAETQSTEVGIYISDHETSFIDGDYEGIVVTRNVIRAETNSSMMAVGVAMGSSLSYCRPLSSLSSSRTDDEEPDKRFLHGAVVKLNTVEGEGVMKAFSVSGVRDWMVVDNTAHLTTRQTPSTVQTTASASGMTFEREIFSPSGFEVDWRTSSGSFQPEFDETVSNNTLPDGVFALLLSFPNSGTTFTHESVSRIAQVRVATSYPQECRCKDKVSSKAYLCHDYSADQEQGICRQCVPGSTDGPYWLRYDLIDPSPGYIFTKTHCGGYDIGQTSLMSQNDFINECTKSIGQDGHFSFYNHDSVDRAIHLFRNPFDNIVSRFRHEGGQDRTVHPKTSDGFREFCRDRLAANIRIENVSETAASLADAIPCGDDFIRYIHWHNMACALTESLRGFKIVHYENFGASLNETFTSVMDFLSLPVVEPAGHFKQGKSYLNYFTIDEAENVRRLFLELATSSTWKHVEHYFRDERSWVWKHNLPACTEQVLKEAFPPRSKLFPSNSSCWDVQDEAAWIPLDRVMNRDSMRFLGRGSKGVVHEAILRTGSSVEDACTVAVKTDKCMNRKTEAPFVSCLHPEAISMKGTTSFMDAEYRGVLVHLATQKEGVDLPGLLPSWGLVGSAGAPLGVVMPLMRFETLHDLIERKDQIVKGGSSEAVASLMLPVVKALDFIDRLGFSHQDVREKNIAVPSGERRPHAILYDNTFLTILDTQSCTLPGDGCKFCRDDRRLSAKFRQPRYTKDMVRRKDSSMLLLILLSLFDLPATHSDRTDLVEALDEALFNDKGTAIGDTALLLENVIRKGRDPLLPFRLVSPMDEISLPVDDSCSNANTISLVADALEFFHEDDLTGPEKPFCIAETVIPDDRGFLRVGQADIENNVIIQHRRLRSDPWEDFAFNLKLNDSSWENIGTYVEGNAAVTLVLDTCNLNQQARSCLSILQNTDIFKANSSFTVMSENVIEVPGNCSPFAGDKCPCTIEDATIWFDRPMNRWRMLFSQFPSLLIDGVCVPRRNEGVGGYAETQGPSVVDRWTYDFRRYAYSNDIRHCGEERGACFTKRAILRVKPRVVLNAGTGGLDGGYLVNEVVEMNNRRSTIALRVFKSQLQNANECTGTIHLVYHAETDSPIPPHGIGIFGFLRAHHVASLFSDDSATAKYPPPQTLIAPWIFDHSGRGQRLVGTLTPLAHAMNLPIQTGSVLKDSPHWRPEMAAEYASLAIESLRNGPVTMSYWSFTIELCHQLGTECKLFADCGEMLVINVVDGTAVSVEPTTDGLFTGDNEWDTLPEEVRSRYETIGVTEATWEDTRDLPTWQELSPEQQQIAMEVHLSQETWPDMMAWSKSTEGLLIPIVSDSPIPEVPRIVGR